MTSQSLGHVLHMLLRPVYEKTPHMSLMMDWPSIVGSDIASYTWPIKIVSPKNSSGIAYIQISPNHAIQAWSVSATLIERINQYLGYQAVSRIRFIKQAWKIDAPSFGS